MSRRLDVVEFYVFSPETREPGRDAGARMFAPLIGIPEESATGMAAGPLACFLHDFLNAKKAEFVIEQGHLMNPPSPSKLLVELSIDDGRINRVLVGGRARVTGRIKVDLA
jgi:PhzF family phenazine biosynthesis protein